MANLLVTGGAGFIGANFVHYWRGQHPDDGVVVLDALTYAGNLREPRRAATASELRVRARRHLRHRAGRERCCASTTIDTIVHFAAESHVDRSITGPDAFISTNVVGTHSLLKAARARLARRRAAARPHRFHHVSTDEVYGSLGPDDPRLHRDHAVRARTRPIRRARRRSDHLVRAYHHTYGLPTSRPATARTTTGRTSFPRS